MGIPSNTKSVWQDAVRSFVFLQRTDPKADQFPRCEGGGRVAT